MAIRLDPHDDREAGIVLSGMEGCNNEAQRETLHKLTPTIPLATWIGCSMTRQEAMTKLSGGHANLDVAVLYNRKDGEIGVVKMDKDGAVTSHVHSGMVGEIS